MNITWLLTGGFACGYRTYILTAIGALGVAAQWAVGDQSTQDALHCLWEMALSLSIAAARAGMARESNGGSA